MTERPILFSAPMVRALLDGSKTQTRRIVKITHRTPGLAACLKPPFGSPRPCTAAELCPHGQPGDRLWVRETHRPIFGQTCGLIAIDYKADPKEKWERMRDHAGQPKWTPSIHMKREYSRIQLEIVSVRVERLNDCSEADAIAEGLRRTCDGDAWNVEDETHRASNPVDSYASLWEAINGAGSWDANPWVWVIEFKRITP